MPSILQGGKKPEPMAPPAEEHEAPMPMQEGGEMRSTMVSHGDGSHSIEHEDGTQTDHPHIGHALMTLASKHSDGKHFHAHSDGMGGEHTVHTSEHGGEPEGHDTQNLEDVKKDLGQFFNEEEHEGGGEEKQDGDSTTGKDYE